MPQTFRTMVMGALALAGWPGLAGFFSKDSILTAVWAASPALFAAGLLTALLTAFYMGRLCLLVFWGEYRGGRHVHESSKRMTVPLWVLNLGSVGAGWFAAPFAGWLGASAEPHSLGIMAASGVVAVAGLGGAYRVYGGGAGHGWAEGEGGLARWLRAGCGVDGFYQLAVVRGMARGGGAWLAAWDRGVIDGGVDGAGWLGRRLGAISKWSDTWMVDGAVRLTAFSVKAASFPVRYLQSGMTQSYGVVIVLSLAAMAGWYLWRSA
jgi:NADH-quinone oxidoreductase subunit L